MAQRILLVSINRCSAPDPVFPLGLAHLDKALSAAGHEVEWFDVQVPGEPLETVLTRFKPNLTGISIRNIDDVLIRKQETFYGPLPGLCQQIRTLTGNPVVLGGSGFSIFPRELMTLSGADFGVCGAGEAPLTALVQALENGGDWRTIPGLAFRVADGTISISPAWSHPLAAEVRAGASETTRSSEGSVPANLVNFYLSAGGMLNVQTQRGCACHCCYCTYPVIEGRAHRWENADRVAADFIEEQKLGAKYVFVVDSVFNSSTRHVTEVCEALIRKGFKLKWGCFLRPQGLTADLMRLMTRAGLAHIEFGSDSFCDEVLEAYGKGFCFDDVLSASELAAREHLDFCHFLISGGPGETEKTLERGFKNSLRLPGAVIMAVVGMRIYPGTQLHRRAISEGLISADTNLLEPRYYVAPPLDAEEVFSRLQRFSQQAPGWIVGDPAPAYERLVTRLRQRGVVGPLWSYLSMLQRVWPMSGGDLPDAGNSR